MDIYREKKGKVTMGNFQEIIKVSEGALAWTYLFSENRIGKVSRHWHQGLELTMVLDGEVLYTVNGKHFTAKKGDVVLINIGDYHSCQIDHRPPGVRGHEHYISGGIPALFFKIRPYLF